MYLYKMILCQNTWQSVTIPRYRTPSMCYGIAIIGMELPCEGICIRIGVELLLSELELDLKMCRTEFTPALAVANVKSQYKGTGLLYVLDR